MTHASPSAAASRSFGKYRVVAKLGEGGMADVYLGLSTGIAGFNKLLVIKRLREEQFDNDEGVKMFVDEARLSALLNHPNVVQTYEVYQQGTTYFTVMEYLEGQSLHSVLHHVRKQRGTLGIPMVVRVACEVLSGLHYAHELRHPNGRALGVVHRDVTPHNIFVTYEGVIKLVDFGVAKAATASSATQAGAIKGKVAYLAPEQLKAPDKLDRRADVFQLGIVLFEGLTGRRYWDGEKQHNIFKRLFTEDLPEFPSDTDVPPELISICKKALAASPDDRYATAEDFRRQLESYLESAHCNVTPRQVGEHVASMFAQRRADTRGLIEAAIRELDENDQGQLSEHDISFPTISVPMLNQAYDPRASSPSFGSGPNAVSGTYGPDRSSSPSFGSGPHSSPGSYGSGQHSPSGSYGSGPHAQSGSYGSGSNGAGRGDDAYGSHGPMTAPAMPARPGRARTAAIIAAAASVAFLAAALLFGNRKTAASGDDRPANAAPASAPASAVVTAPQALAPAPSQPPEQQAAASASATSAVPTQATPGVRTPGAWRRPPVNGTAANTAPAATPQPTAAPPAPTNKKRERDIE